MPRADSAVAVDAFSEPLARVLWRRHDWAVQWALVRSPASVIGRPSNTTWEMVKLDMAHLLHRFVGLHMAQLLRHLPIGVAHSLCLEWHSHCTTVAQLLHAISDFLASLGTGRRLTSGILWWRVSAFRRARPSPCR